jgi:hypothetical protein
MTFWITCAIVVATYARDDQPAFTDASKAGPDFTVQGEYIGFVEADGNRWGAQVIALGDGKFHVVGYLGGLPGDGWSRGDERNEVDGQMIGDTAIFETDEYVLNIKDGVLKIETPSGEMLGELKKTERKSPTLGAKPPAGAVVLFGDCSPQVTSNPNRSSAIINCTSNFGLPSCRTPAVKDEATAVSMFRAATRFRSSIRLASKDATTNAVGSTRSPSRG